MRMIVKSFKKTIAASGTPEALATNIKGAQNVIIKASAGNGGLVSIGDSAVQEFELAAGAQLDLSQMLGKDGGSSSVDLSKVYCKAAANGYSVCVIYAIESGEIG